MPIRPFELHQTNMSHFQSFFKNGNYYLIWLIFPTIIDKKFLYRLKFVFADLVKNSGISSIAKSAIFTASDTFLTFNRFKKKRIVIII